jgi:hypothetical protein
MSHVVVSDIANLRGGLSAAARFRAPGRHPTKLAEAQKRVDERQMRLSRIGHERTVDGAT